MQNNVNNATMAKRKYQTPSVEHETCKLASVILTSPTIELGGDGDNITGG